MSQGIKQYYANGAMMNSPSGSEQVIEVGTTGGTDARYNPLYEFYEYYWTGQILEQSDINLSGLVRKIAFYQQKTSATEYTINDLTIKMGHIGSNIFPVAAVKEDFTQIPGVSNLATVFDGTFVRTAGVGWKEITLDTEFSYNNTDNLIIKFEYKNGAYKSPSSQSAEWSYDSRSNGSALEYSASAYPTTDGARQNYVPTTKLTIFG